jgi:hypothetical protein
MDCRYWTYLTTRSELRAIAFSEIVETEAETAGWVVPQEQSTCVPLKSSNYF